MFPDKPDLIVLPFKAVLKNSDLPLTLDQTLALLRKGVQIQIERSHPGASDAIGWTIFRRTTKNTCTRTSPSSASNAAHAATSAKPMPFITRVSPATMA